MRCLICFREMGDYPTIKTYFFNKDIICRDCREKLGFAPARLTIEGVKVYSLYPYRDFFTSMLLQYKEAYDEALSDIFLKPYISSLYRRYIRYTLIPLPSGKSDLERRGFNHNILTFKSLGLPILDCLYKKKDYNQSGLNNRQRQLMINNIGLKENTVLPKRILLVDDVLTSGATLTGAIRLLKTENVLLECLTLAYVNR